MSFDKRIILIYLFIYLFMYLFIYLFIYVFIYLSIYLFIYLFIHLVILQVFYKYLAWIRHEIFYLRYQKAKLTSSKQ